MYCKYCGKQIEEDSLFCKHCGENLRDSRNEPKVSLVNMRLLEQFKSLSFKTQILIIAYIIYLLCLICCIEDMDYSGFIALAFLIPFILVCLVYLKDRIEKIMRSASKKVKHVLFYKSRKRNNNKTAVTVSSTIFPITAKNGKSNKTLIVAEPLLLFAKSYSKIQLVEQTVNAAKECYCLLESENERTIHISFSKNLGILSAEEISKKKNELIVKEYSDGSFELDYM